VPVTCKWGASALLMTGSVACAMETGYAEGDFDSEDELGTVEQQIVTPIEKSRIDAKRRANSHLGAAYDPNPATAYWETNAGVVRQYSTGAVLYNRSKSTAYIADWDAYYGWSWIGGGYFGYPNDDQRAMASNSAFKVLPLSGGFIVTNPSTRDNWPVMTHVNVNYSNGGATVWCSLDYNVQTRPLATTCTGINFPPNTSVKTGVSGRTGISYSVTTTNNSSGRFTARLLPASTAKFDTYNNIITFFSRAATGIASYQSQDFAGVSQHLNQTKNKY
jgi:hypothetical protein